MKSIDITEAETRFYELLEDAKRQPVVIRREGIDCAIVLSMREYELLRADSIRAFLALRNDVAREASEAGLTEDTLDELMSDD